MDSIPGCHNVFAGYHDHGHDYPSMRAGLTPSLSVSKRNVRAFVGSRGVLFTV